MGSFFKSHWLFIDHKRILNIIGQSGTGALTGVSYGSVVLQCSSSCLCVTEEQRGREHHSQEGQGAVGYRRSTSTELQHPALTVSLCVCVRERERSHNTGVMCGFVRQTEDEQRGASTCRSVNGRAGGAAQRHAGAGLSHTHHSTILNCNLYKK